MNPSDTAIILLHEIYGVNEHLREQEQRYSALGFFPYILDFYNGKVFPYTAAQDAYAYFFEYIGFESARDRLLSLAASLKPYYEQIYVVGYSVGATTAWLCAGRADLFAGLVCFYGSRIRDFRSVKPHCPVLLLHSMQDSALSVPEANTLVETHIVNAPHGFADRFSDRFEAAAEQQSQKYINAFFAKLT